ncbi:tyrosine recombinase XerC [Rhizobium sp.]|uniref:site-specific integrase n=1 Tax=Rhizobium sp. TaxID=391 RepID=UPI0028AC9D3D
MSVYKLKNSPFYQFDFRVNGHRFHGSTKTRNQREAKAIERELKEKAVAETKRLQATGRAPLTMDIAVGRFWLEKGQYRKRPHRYFRTLEILVAYFGKDTRLDEIDDQAVSRLVAHKLAQPRWGKQILKHGEVTKLKNGTVNRDTLVPLKAIFRRARLVWKYDLPNEPLWEEHWLKEPQERVRELSRVELAALEESSRPDYRRWYKFIRLSGRRLAETIIRWSDVNWDANEITTKGKGDRYVWTPITPTIRAILEECLGDHPEYVFTYVARRTREGRIKGQRYPLTYAGAQSEWRRHRKRSKVVNVRLHDHRHDTATKLLRQTKNLKLVQRVLNHADLKTTSKYAHVMDDEIAEALELNANSQNLSQSSREDNA